MEVKKHNNGITLVALVVTIIVLLILASVSLNLVLGENGIITMAKRAKENMELAKIEEENMLNTLYEQLYKETPKISESKGSYFEEDTLLQDSYGNKVVVPTGFKIAEDSGDNVTEGVVIEDNDIQEGIGEGRGNQFVWIPVSNTNGDGTGLITKDNGEKVEITLARYNDFSVENPVPTQKGSDYEESVNIPHLYYPTYYFSETDTHPQGGVPAKNLHDFVTSVEKNHGYYIARYEASYASDKSPTGSYSTSNYMITDQKVASKKTTRTVSEGIANNSSIAITKGQLWRYVSQYDASRASQNMYDGNSYVVSDLINSYAWDTAIIYIQKMLNIDYASQIDNNKTLHNTGDIGDEVCKIYDMKGNLTELSTEYSTYYYPNQFFPYVARGGSYDYDNMWTSLRGAVSKAMFDRGSYIGFRPLMYIAI